MGVGEANRADLLVRMVPFKERDIAAPDFAREVKLALQETVVGAKIRTAVAELTGGKDGAPVELFIIGSDLNALISFADTLRRAISTIPGVIDAKTSVEGGNPEIRITPDRARMATLGIQFDHLGAELTTAFSGNTDAKFKSGSSEWDINIRLSDFDRRSIADVQNFALPNTRGEMIRIGQFADVRESEGASQLDRRNRMSSVTVSSQVAGRPVGTVGADIQTVIAATPLPDGVSIEYGGQLAQQDEAFGTLGFALLVSILLVYLIMVLLYDNYVRPFVVMFSIPLALIGALLALALTMQTLSLFTMLGIIMLVGLVAKNAIVLVDFAGQMQAEGMAVKEALIEAVRKRFRPILMMLISSVAGMLPIALAQGAGAEWKNGMAWVIIGGITSSMFLTLIVVPLVYYGIERVREKIGG
jgi:HAE1 family hydrophobic/amphiphilic exporter-1